MMLTYSFYSLNLEIESMTGVFQHLYLLSGGSGEVLIRWNKVGAMQCELVQRSHVHACWLQALVLH